MDLVARREQLQKQATALAVEESNLAEQIEGLRALERRITQVNRQKHQIAGALAMLDEMIQAQEANKTEE